jgi:hypothetical protein
MNWWRRIFHRRRLEEQLDAELEFHLETQIRDYVRAGMSEPEARRAAVAAFGNPPSILWRMIGPGIPRLWQ